MKNSLKNITLLALFTFCSSWVFAIGVNKPEVQSVGGDDVIQFQNYNGPHSKIDSMASIRAIGSGLGNTVAKNINTAATIGSGKYYVIHCVDSSTKEKLDADIFIIGENATVDHIKNLRAIISAYLVSAYDYSSSDASTLATFITVYNAVYRGKLDVFNAKYKKIVTKNLTGAKCGLSTKWSDWAGKSQIVIPLSDLQGGLSTIDTSVISDKDVINSMQEEDDKGVDERKNMVDIKEREAEEATEKAQEASKTAAKEEKKAEDAQKKADQAKAESNADPNNQQKKQAAQDAQNAADQQKEKAQDARDEAQKQQSKADQKQSEALAERTEIARDQQKLLEEALAEAANKNAVIGLKITDSSNNMSGMVKVDGITGKTIRESPVTVVRGRTILPVTSTDVNTTEEMYMAICGENSKNGIVKLCLLDSQNMEIQAESKEEIAENSVLVQNNEDYYCVAKEGSEWVLGQFDKNLKCLRKSKVAVTPETPVTITSKGIIVTGTSGLTMLLSLDDLSLINTNSKSTSSRTSAPEK